MSEDRLTRDDLVLLMESYRNMITMHQTILEQTTKTIDKLDNIATKQDSLFSKQGNICVSIDKLSGKVDTSVENTERVASSLNAHEKKSIDDHNKITNKVYIGWIGMATIIVALIGLLVTLSKSIPMP